jgi:mono/diheme cytochrome c family protein
MVLKNILLLGIVGLFFYACNESEQKPENISKQTPSEQGASLYTMHCAQCHGEDGKLGASGAKDLSQSRLSDAQITTIIKNGKGAMPSMKALLETKENINLVLSHVKGLRQ